MQGQERQTDSRHESERERKREKGKIVGRERERVEPLLRSSNKVGGIRLCMVGGATLSRSFRQLVLPLPPWGEDWYSCV